MLQTGDVMRRAEMTGWGMYEELQNLHPFSDITNQYISIKRGTRWRSWLRHCATNRNVAGLIPGGVIDIIVSVVIWPWVRLSL
jgi:hypothetical protein